MKTRKSVFLALSVVCCILMFAVTAQAKTQAGGWKVNFKSYDNLSKAETRIFNAAFKGTVGVDYTPTAVMAKQVVSGTNYAFLTTRNTVTLADSYEWCVVEIFKSLKGKVTLVAVNPIDISSVKTTKVSPTGKEGAWKCVLKKTSKRTVPKKAEKVFNKTGAKYKKIKLSPVCLLGTQVVNGTNYRFICRGVKNKQTDVYVVTVYYKNNKAKITDCQLFNFTGYMESTTA